MLLVMDGAAGGGWCCLWWMVLLVMDGAAGGGSWTKLTYYCLVLHAVRRMSLDSWAPVCPGSGNILF